MKLSYFRNAIKLKQETWIKKKIFCLILLKEEGFSVQASGPDGQPYCVKLISLEQMAESNFDILTMTLEECIHAIEKEIR